ncbi:hypothetical protein K438DRAFT_886299 [Mycena galopus ATCC 62051]|nr:hypothetical protein K438DRAFT_886299 [Mycena galopus ATCC 62051]
MKLHDAYDTLKTRFQDAKVAYEQLNVRYDTLQSCYTTLVNTVGDRLSAAPATTPASANPGNDLPPSMSTSDDHLQLLDREDYPLVTYWTEGEFLTAEKKRKDDKGKAGMADPKSKRGAQRLVQDDENVVYWFIEDKDGNPVTGRRAKSMRDQARQIWKSLQKKGQTPARWGDADSVVRSYYAGEMRRFFPELQLCELDFKSHRIAINIYPAWHAKWVAETPAPALKRSASQAPEGEPVNKKYRGRKKANQSSSADDLLPPTDPASALSASGVPTSSSALSASSLAPPPVLALAPVSIAPSPSVISAGPIPQPPPPAVPLLSTASQSITLPSPVDLSAAVTKNLPIQMELDSDIPLAPASGPSTSTPAATAAGPSTSTPAAKAASPSTSTPAAKAASPSTNTPAAKVSGPSTSTPAMTAIGAGATVTAVRALCLFVSDY